MKNIFILLLCFIFISPAFAQSAIMSDDTVDSYSAETENITEIMYTYINNLVSKINWVSPESENLNDILLAIKIGKNGELIDVNILNSSGSKEVDKMALDSINNASPFEPLPSIYKKQDITFRYILKCTKPKEEYAAYNTNENNSNSEEIAPMPQPTDWNMYMTDVCLKIKTNWKPQGGGKVGRARVSLIIGKNGELLSSDIQESSGSKKIDDSIVKAINASAPFEPFPIDSMESNLNVILKFFKATNSYNINYLR